MSRPDQEYYLQLAEQVDFYLHIYITHTEMGEELRLITDL